MEGCFRVVSPNHSGVNEASQPPMKDEKKLARAAASQCGDNKDPRGTIFLVSCASRPFLSKKICLAFNLYRHCSERIVRGRVVRPSSQAALCDRQATS